MNQEPQPPRNRVPQTPADSLAQFEQEGLERRKAAARLVALTWRMHRELDRQLDLKIADPRAGRALSMIRIIL